MAIEPGSIDHLSQIISQVVAPSFLLSSVAGFISALSTRLTAVFDRLRNLNAILGEGHVHTWLKTDIPRLRRRAKLLNRTISFAIGSGMAATILIIVAFALALAEVSHVWIAAVLFMISLALLCAALVVFGAEVKIGLSDYDHH